MDDWTQSGQIVNFEKINVALSMGLVWFPEIPEEI